MLNRLALVLIVMLALGVSLDAGLGQDVAIRAGNEEFLRQYAETYRFSLGRPRSAQVTADGSAALFLRSPPRSFVQDLYEFDCRTGRGTYRCAINLRNDERVCPSNS